MKNAYRSPLSINRLDWDRAWENRSLADYYRGLIGLRMRLPGLRDKTPQAAERLQSASSPAENCAVFLLDNAGPGSRWERILLAFSARDDAVTLPLPPGAWEVLADGEDSFLWKRPRTVRDPVPLSPVSALVLGQR